MVRDGLEKVWVAPVIFGYRVRAGQGPDASSHEADYCCGNDGFAPQISGLHPKSTPRREGSNDAWRILAAWTTVRYPTATRRMTFGG